MEGDKIYGIKEGPNQHLHDFIDSKYDVVIQENCGTIEITGSTEFLRDWIVVDKDYQRTDEEDKVVENA